MGIKFGPRDYFLWKKKYTAQSPLQTSGSFHAHSFGDPKLALVCCMPKTVDSLIWCLSSIYNSYTSCFLFPPFIEIIEPTTTSRVSSSGQYPSTPPKYALVPLFSLFEEWQYICCHINLYPLDAEQYCFWYSWVVPFLLV